MARTLEAVESVARHRATSWSSARTATVLDWATDVGVRTLRQRTVGLNAGVREARDDVIAGGAQAVVIVPIDLPFITASRHRRRSSAALFEASGPTVVLVPDRHGTGTNALALRPPDVDRRLVRVGQSSHPSSGGRSGGRRVPRARRAAAGGPGHAEDLVLVETIRAEGSHVG